MRLLPRSRRSALLSLAAATLLSRPAAPQVDIDPIDGRHRPPRDHDNEDPRMPDGKSQKNAIAKQLHEQALKDADELLVAAQALRKELEAAGTFVVPLSSVKRTEDIEKLAKRIRGRLKS